MATEYELQRLVVRLTGDGSDYKAMLAEAEKQTQSAIEHIEKLGNVLNRSFMAPVKAASIAGVKSFASFDLAIMESASLVKGITDKQIKQLRDAALDLGTRGKQGPVELAKAFYGLFSAGMGVDEAIKALPSVADFATAGAFDLAKATNLLGSALGSLGLKSEDPIANLENLQRVSSGLARATTLAHGTMEDYSRALARDSATTMRQYNISLEQGLATLSAFGEQGIEGAYGGNVFGRLIRLLSSGAIRHGDIQQQLNFDVFDKQTGKFRDIADILEDLDKLQSKFNYKGQAAFREALGFKALQQKSLNPLKDMSKKIREFTKEIKEAMDTNFTGQVVNTQMKAFSNQWKQTQNILEVAKIEIGELLAPALGFLNQQLRNVISSFITLNPAAQTVIVTIGAILAAVGPLMLAIRLLGPSILMALHLMAGMGVPVAAGILLATAAVVGFIRQAGGVEAAWKQVSEYVQSVWESFTSAIKTAVATIYDFLTSSPLVTDFFAGFLTGAMLTIAALKAIGEALLTGAQEVYQWVMSFTEASSTIAQVIGFDIGRFLVLIVAVKAVTIAYSMLSAVLTALGIKQMIMSTIWVAWNTILITTSVTIALVNAAITATIAVLGSLSTVVVVLNVAWLAMVAVFKGFLALLGLAMVAMTGWVSLMAVLQSALLVLIAPLQLLMAVINLPMLIAIAAAVLAVVVAFQLLKVLFQQLGAVASSLFQTITAVKDVLLEIPRASSPLAAMGDIFREWGSILGSIWEAFSVDSNIAMKMVKVGFDIVVEHVKTLFQPLGSYLGTFFQSIFDYVSTYFKLSMVKALGDVQQEFADTTLGRLMGVRLRGAIEDIEWNAKIEKRFETLKDKIGTDLTGAARNFNDALFDARSNSNLGELRKQFDGLKNDLQEAKWDRFLKNLPTVEMPINIDEARKKAKEAGENVGDNYNKPIKEKTQKAKQDLQAILFGSASFFSEFYKYLEGRTKPPGEDPFDIKTQDQQKKANEWMQPLVGPLPEPIWRKELTGPPRPDEYKTPAMLDLEDKMRAEDMKKDEGIEIAKEMRDLLKEIAGKSGLEVSPVGLS